MRLRHRVLVIDDDPLFRGLIVSLLRHEFLVTTAKDGTEGFYEAIETVPDVVVVDVRMPGWDGIRTVQALRGHRTTADCKIVMLTADSTPDTALAAIRAGADDYLVKTSFTNSELVQTIATLAGRRTEPLRPRIRSVAVDTELERPPSGAETERALQEVVDGWE